MTGTDRGQWSSRLGFILAAAGSAIGLGNIWRFPYTAGENGGAAFILVYLIFIVAIGVPVQLCELSLGRKSTRAAVGAFKVIAPGTKWSFLGVMGVMAGFGILSFYAVIAGWTVGYLYFAITGSFTGIDQTGSTEIFTTLVSGSFWPILLLAVFMIVTALVVQGGIQGGIERAARILMPLFFVFLVVLAIRSLTLPGASEGIAFLTQVDFSKLNFAVMGNALGQALFSLSLGMGAMITYGSYLKKDENLPVAAASVAIFDTSIALLAGLIIFPAVFAAGMEPSAGPGLVFMVMPIVLTAMPGGSFFAFLFYFLLAIAALTSTISLLEVIVSYFVDERDWSRPKAVWSVAALCFLIGVPSALANGANGFLSGQVFGTDFLSFMDLVFGKYFLTIGAGGICIFAGWFWGIPKALEEIENGGHKLPGAPLWSFLVRFVCPVAVIVLLYMVITGQAAW